jgi:hypothetical protein
MTIRRYILCFSFVFACPSYAQSDVAKHGFRDKGAYGSDVVKAYLERFLALDRRLISTEPADMKDIPQKGVEWAWISGPKFASDFPSYSIAVHRETGRFWITSSGGYTGIHFTTTGRIESLVDVQHAAPVDRPQAAAH